MSCLHYTEQAIVRLLDIWESEICVTCGIETRKLFDWVQVQRDSKQQHRHLFTLQIREALLKINNLKYFQGLEYALVTKCNITCLFPQGIYAIF